ncbi:MAG TPA: ankyrin repeat domain-containing protein [Pirellulaceae bacterium]|nr:ankyrin repeat domain-containing protein [Pirellulaceae bacterium]
MKLLEGRRMVPGVFLMLALACASAVAGESRALVANAAEQQDRSKIRAVLDARADVKAPQADGMTALHWAAYHDDAEVVRLLLAAGADAKAANRYGVTPLSLACINGNGDIARQLLAAGADPNAALPGGETPLMTAARTGRLGAVQALLNHGAKFNAKERKGQTALMWAAAEGNVEVVDALLKAGADFRTPLRSGFTPFFFAIREGRDNVVARLLEAGIDVNEPLRPATGKAMTPLLLAVENGHFELAAALLQAGADPNARPAGYTALHAINWVRKPIRGDGDPPPIGSGQLTSLDLVRELVAHKADINCRLEKGESGRGRFTTTGSTPFLVAARASDVPLMQLLLELKADPAIANADDSPPLLAAAGVGALNDGDESAGTEEEALAAVRLLLQLGADVNAVDKNGETAMHGAAYQSRAKVVELLAEHEADVKIWNRKNKFGWTPLMIAQGHRPGNFRPAPDTIAAIERIMRSAGDGPPRPAPRGASPRND